MKPPIKKHEIPPSRSFIVKELNDPFFDPHWHFHKECQLFLVLEGSGTRFIGDNIKPFREGDLVLTGPLLPHLWRSDDSYFEKNSPLKTRGIVLYFNEDFLGEACLMKEEMTDIRLLIEKSVRGLEFTGETNLRVQQMMQELSQLQGVDSIIKMLGILNCLAKSKDYHVIANVGYNKIYKDSDHNYMNLVHEYVMSNFKKNISLDEVAALVNMTASSFCRYFKARANKSFFTFVKEVRTGHACKLLQKDELNITQVCYESGFRTLSNFNKQFKEVTQKTPLLYRKECLRNFEIADLEVEG